MSLLATRGERCASPTNALPGEPCQLLGLRCVGDDDDGEDGMAPAAVPLSIVSNEGAIPAFSPSSCPPSSIK